MSTNAPVYGCHHCMTVAGRDGCPYHSARNWVGAVQGLPDLDVKLETMEPEIAALKQERDALALVVKLNGQIEALDEAKRIMAAHDAAMTKPLEQKCAELAATVDLLIHSDFCVDDDCPKCAGLDWGGGGRRDSVRNRSSPPAMPSSESARKNMAEARSSAGYSGISRADRRRPETGRSLWTGS